jgi:Sugar (and other) transporter
MGGGGQPIGRGYWKNAMANTPSEALNWRLAFSVLCFGLMVCEMKTQLRVQRLIYGVWGAARGLDEGLISGTISQISFENEYHLSVNKAKTNADAIAQRTGIITAMVQIGSVAGALIAFLACDRIGRIWATRQLTLV